MHRESDGAGDHFERLAGLVDGVLTSVGVRVEDLSHVRIGLGPGSFTGLRIGMSFAKGVAVAAKLPLVGVSSFAGVAQALAADGGVAASGRMLVIADARRDEVFLAEYISDAQGVREVSAARIEPAASVERWATQYPTGVVVTPSVGNLLCAAVSVCVESRVAKGLVLVDVGPQAEFSVEQVADLEPTYLRAVAAKSIAERAG